jgi:gamma-glutamylcyclotransferase (GGCT)/AIG2-like uncharacterized protein YtfP
MLYFAYGMNTNQGQMSLRCPDARSLGQAVLYGHEFRFARHADIIENPAFNTQGVLWDITEECEQSLDALEGYPMYYLKKTVNVFHNGRPVECMVYFMADQDNIKDELPSDGYLDMLFEGYAEHDVNTEQIIDSLDTINILNHNYQQIQEKYYPEEAQ